VVIDKSGANLAGLENINCLLIMNGWFWLIDILQVKYLNNIIEQDHRFIKKLTKQMIAITISFIFSQLRHRSINNILFIIIRARS